MDARRTTKSKMSDILSPGEKGLLKLAHPLSRSQTLVGWRDAIAADRSMVSIFVTPLAAEVHQESSH